MVDLHVHSCRSDGTLTPTELVDYAIEKGLSAFALTDHDTTTGVREAVNYAEKLKKEGVSGVPEVIPGIELSCELNHKDIHVVGLYVDPEAPVFKKFLQSFIDSRDRRNVEMCKRMTEGGLPISYDDLKAHFPDAVITRAHYAAYMVEKGYVKSKTEAFERYIGDRCPYYIPRERIAPEKGVEMVLEAGGIPVLAHPILYRLSDSNLEALVKSLKSHGLIGIEGVYSTYSPSEEREIRTLAAKYNLLVSGGSDFHGANKDNIDLGVGRGKLYIDDSILAGIKKARKNVLFTDMDGTLLLNDSTISKAMHDALETMKKNGHRLVLTSGRPLPSILERMELLGISRESTYIISNNGGLIYDAEKDKTIRQIKLESGLVREVVKLCDEAGLHVHCYTDKEIVGYEEDEELKYYRRRIHMPFIKTSDIAGFLKDGSYKVQIISLDNFPALERLRDEILCKLGDRVEAFFSNTQYLEILPKGIDKGEAVLFMENYLPVPHTNTFAAGDAENDLPMIKAAGTGIAMKNAGENIKAAADVVTADTNDRDGLMEIIDRYFN